MTPTVQQLIDIRRDLEAQLAGINLQIAMELGNREEALRHMREMYAITTARKAAREVGAVAG